MSINEQYFSDKNSNDRGEKWEEDTIGLYWLW